MPSVNSLKNLFRRGWLLLILIWPLVGQTATIDELRSQIDDRNKEIKRLEAEISQYQKDLSGVRQNAKTLSGEIGRLDLTRQKLAADIKVTEAKVNATGLTINKLELEIENKNTSIDDHRQAIREALQAVGEADQESLLEVILSETSLSQAVNRVTALEELNRQLRQTIGELLALKTELEDKRRVAEEQRVKLVGLKAELGDQKKIADANRLEKDRLLIQTKNQEANYQKLLAERLARKRQVEEEMRQAEDELRIKIDPASLPRTGRGVLSWPLAKIIITQYFGNTAFASQNPQVYNGQGHNGIDLGASVGTPVKAARQGVVRGKGDTDSACAGASYGKWILIDHDNGLSTLYAHLSLIRVSASQSIDRGDLIAYSGNTGYSTGPHLHFSVFASPGVKIGSLQSRVPGCGTYTLPLGSRGSYLNPLSYL